jgi:hypothetical protein
MGPILGVFFLGSGQLFFKFVNCFGDCNLMIADTFCVAFNFTIVTALSESLAPSGIKILHLSEGDTGIGIGAPANVEF